MKQDVDTVIKFQEKTNKNEKYMRLALKEAMIAYQNGDVPVGCVIVKDDKVIAKAHNIRQAKKDTLGHAEVVAIKKACKKLNAWVLEGCTIYVTLEPCLMCAGAILNARIDELVYATEEPKFGSIESVAKVLDNDKYNHNVKIEKGVLKEEASQILKNFFKEIRIKKTFDKTK